MRPSGRGRAWAMVAALVAVLALQACGGAEPAPAAAPAPARASAVAAAPVSSDELMAWAEATWPDLFPAGPASQPLRYEGIDYMVRLYPVTGNATGVAADGGVWGLGPFTGQVLTSFGHIGDFTCLVAPERCPVVNPSCTTTVASGFGGDLNAVYDAGGDGSADGDGGSAGVGGSEGKVLGARLRVYRLSDGALLGEGTTDPVQGLATVKWCKADLPVLLQLQGAPGASYYDEAVDNFVPFPVEQTLHAMVERFDENVGVSALTEAAYQYAVTTYAPQVVQQQPGRARALAAAGATRGLTATQVRAANARMLVELNRRFTNRLQQRSIKALATPIDQRSADAALPRNRYGRMAALTGGFAKVARSYSPDETAPALAFSRQLAQDMTDGVIDDHGADGQPVAAPGRATYKGTEAGLNWTVGLGVLGQRFGRLTTLSDSDVYLDVVSVWLGYDPRCSNGQGEVRGGNYTLSAIGTVTFTDNRAPAGGCIWDSGTTFTHQLDFLTGVRRLVATAGGDRAFAIAGNGDLYGWGWNRCGRVGNGLISDTISERPVKLPGLSRVVAVVPTIGINVALTATGDVHTWGPNVNNLLGQAGAANDPQCLDLLRGMPPASATPVRVIVTPRKLPGLQDISAISGSSRFVNAVRRDGRVFQWGYTADADGRVTLQPTPVELSAVGAVRKVTSNEQMSFAIIGGGRVISWWVEPQDIFEGESTTSVKPPKLLRSVSNVVDLASDPLGVTLALRGDGGLYVWGRWSGASGPVATAPRNGADFAVRRGGVPLAGGLPRIVRVTVSGNFATAIGADNESYVFTPGSSVAASYWDATPRFTGLPLPF